MLLQRKHQTRARNPRFLMPLFGHKTGFRARMNEIKSGIPCSASDGRPARISNVCCVLLTHHCNVVTKKKRLISRSSCISHVCCVLSTHHPCNVATRKTSDDRHASRVLVVFCNPCNVVTKSGDSLLCPGHSLSGKLRVLSLPPHV
jgi:hypothetical protein